MDGSQHAVLTVCNQPFSTVAFKGGSMRLYSLPEWIGQKKSTKMVFLKSFKSSLWTTECGISRLERTTLGFLCLHHPEPFRPLREARPATRKGTGKKDWIWVSFLWLDPPKMVVVLLGFL